MKRHVMSPKYLQVLDFAIFYLESNAFKVVLVTGLLTSVRMLYFSEAISTFKERYPSDY